MIARCLVLMALMIVQACTPDHNWREVSTAQYRVMLPGKAAKLSRDVVLGSSKVSLEMHGAKALQTSYTVAVADLAVGVSPEAVLADMQAGMLKNIGAVASPAQVPTAAAVSVSAVDAQNKALAPINGREIIAKGQAPIEGKQVPVEMRARFVQLGQRVVQAVAMGPSLDVDQTKTFFDSLRVISPINAK